MLGAEELIAERRGWFPGHGAFDAPGERADDVGQLDQGFSGEAAAECEANEDEAVEEAELKFEAEAFQFLVSVDLRGERGDNAREAVDTGEIATELDDVVAD